MLLQEFPGFEHAEKIGTATFMSCLGPTQNSPEQTNKQKMAELLKMPHAPPSPTGQSEQTSYQH